MRGIGEVTLINGGYIYVHYVSAAQKLFRAGYAVAYDIVDARAHAFGEALVEEGGGDCVVVGSETVNHVVYLGGGHAFAYIGRYVIQQCRVYLGAFAYAGQLFFRAQQVARGSLHPSFLYCWILASTSSE